MSCRLRLHMSLSGPLSLSYKGQKTVHGGPDFLHCPVQHCIAETPWERRQRNKHNAWVRKTNAERYSQRCDFLHRMKASFSLPPYALRAPDIAGHGHVNSLGSTWLPWYADRCWTPAAGCILPCKTLVCHKILQSLTELSALTRSCSSTLNSGSRIF